MGAMDVAALELELHLPHARSLKDKRGIIRPILDGARHRYRVAAAEVDFQDKWQRTRLGFSFVSGDGGHASEVLRKVEAFVWSFPDIEVTSAEQAVFDWDDG